jgi:hypothetical protein
MMGGLTPQQIKEETGLLNQEIMPALHRLQEAFVVYEDRWRPTGIEPGTSLPPNGLRLSWRPRPERRRPLRSSIGFSGAMCLRPSSRCRTGPGGRREL